MSQKCQRATSTRSRSVRSGGRDRKLKESTLRLAPGRPQPPTMGFDNRAADREAHAHAVGLRRVEGCLSNARQVYRHFDRLTRVLSCLRPTMSETVLRRIWQAMERWRWRAVALAVGMLLAIAVFSLFGVTAPDRTAHQSFISRAQARLRARSPFARRV